MRQIPRGRLLALINHRACTSTGCFGAGERQPDLQTLGPVEWSLAGWLVELFVGALANAALTDHTRQAAGRAGGPLDWDGPLLVAPTNRRACPPPSSEAASACLSARPPVRPLARTASLLATPHSRFIIIEITQHSSAKRAHRQTQSARRADCVARLLAA